MKVSRFLTLFFMFFAVGVPAVFGAEKLVTLDTALKDASEYFVSMLSKDNDGAEEKRAVAVVNLEAPSDDLASHIVEV